MSNETMTMLSTSKTFNLKQNELEELIKKGNLGDSEAAIKIYQYYSFSNYDLDKSLHWLKIAASLGMAVAQYNLASHYYYDIKDYDSAATWAKKAIENGDDSAQKFIKK